MTRLIGRAAAIADLAQRRKEIDLRNQLARAVRLMASKESPADFCPFDNSKEMTVGRYAAQGEGPHAHHIEVMTKIRTPAKPKPAATHLAGCVTCKTGGSHEAISAIMRARP